MQYSAVQYSTVQYSTVHTQRDLFCIRSFKQQKVTNANVLVKLLPLALLVKDMDSPTMYAQWVSGGRPPEGGLVAEVSADDNEVLSEEQEVEREKGWYNEKLSCHSSFHSEKHYHIHTVHMGLRMGPN